MKSKRPIVFVHVEKVGGSTVNVMLHKFILGFVSPSPERGYTLNKHDFNFIKRFYPLKINGVGGHRIDSKTQYFDNQYVFSMVREPIDRLISHYNWQKYTMGIDRDFEEFFNDPHFQNFQTFRLTGSRNEDEALEVINKKFDFIGLLEAYNDSIKILSKDLFGDPFHLSYRRENTTKKSDKILKRADISESTLKRLIELNKVDVKIYKSIKENFYTKYGDQLTKPQNVGLSIPKSSVFKRKLSNSYIRYVLQPFIQDKVKYGY